MTIHVVLCVVAEFYTIVTQSTVFAISNLWLFLCIAHSDYFIHQESSLPPKCLQHFPYPVEFADLPLPAQSTWNHIFSFMALSTWLGSCRVMLTFLQLFHPPVIIIFFSRAPSKGLYYFGHCFPTSDYSIHQELFLSPTAHLQEDQGSVGCCRPPSDYSIQQE